MIDNLWNTVISPWLVPVANATDSNPMDIRSVTHLRNAAVDYETVLYLLIPNGTADNTQAFQLIITRSIQIGELNTEECLKQFGSKILGF